MIPRRVDTNKRLPSIAIVSFLVTAGFLGFITSESEIVSAANVWYVGTGPGNISATINGGISQASDGDTVYVYSGTYYENVVVDRTINLTGENRDTTIINASGIGDAVYISADWVNITGFTAIGSGDEWGDAGTELDKVRNCRVIGNNASDIQNGIFLNFSDYNTLADNIGTQNRDPYFGNGIYLAYSSNNILINNTASNNQYGIYLSSSSSNTLANNTASSNTNCGIYLRSSSNNNKLTNNIATNNDYGIYLHWSSNNNKLTNNTASNNDYGIYVRYSSYNTFVGNSISSNKNGIYIFTSSYNTFIGNTIFSNRDHGIHIYSDGYNTIYHNVFTNNNGSGVQAVDYVGTNYWNDIYPSGGNYWSDWTTPDVMSGPNQDQMGSDGIVDVPYSLDGGAGAKDYYPLTTPPPAVDSLPPEITNLQPPDASIINDDTPVISADYSDPSGIDINSVVLMVDSVDVTSFATVTASGVSYIPGIALPDGIHTVYVEVKDNIGNLAIAMWTFTVDSTPPTISNLLPPDASITNDSTPVIGADYTDPSGINVSTVVLKVDGVDVTSSATVTAGGVTYIPLTALSDGVHTVYIEVKDNIGNLATATWSFTVDIAIYPPVNLTTKAVNNGNNVELEWDPPSSPTLDHYLIYRADSVTEFDFAAPYNSSTTWPDPMNTTWVDPDPEITAVDDDFYYIVRAANFNESDVSVTSNTAGVWTRTFESGVSTFSLPLEPFVKKDTEFYCQDMNATYIKYMDPATHTWIRHDRGDSGNNSLIEVGEGYEIGFLGKSIQTKYTFCGMPGAMIIFKDDKSFLGFDPMFEARSLEVSIKFNGDVNLTWQEPPTMALGDYYEIYYSNTRDGFFGDLNNNYFLAGRVDFGTNIATHLGAGANDPGKRLYYMVVPFYDIGIKGASTYSVGIWTEEYLSGYDTLGIPLKLSSYQTVDWYCDNITNTVGINYFNIDNQEWSWHSTRMPAGAFDPILEMALGYQISTSNATKFIFIGV